jgi:hypothetical protein
MAAAAAAAIAGQHNPSDHPSTLASHITSGHTADDDPMNSNDHVAVVRNNTSGHAHMMTPSTVVTTHESLASTQAVTRTTMTP